MFTEIYKSCMKFGDVYLHNPSGLTHTDSAKDKNGNIRYYNKNFPIGANSTTSRANIESGFVFYDDVIADDYIDISHAISSTFVSTSINNDGSLTVRRAITNNTSSDLVIKSIGFVKQIGCYTSTSATSTSNYEFLAFYENLLTPITVPANDSVFVDITLSSGDISLVQES